MPQMEVNYFAVLTVSLISYVIGAFWFSPLLFYKQWLLAIGKTEEDIKKRGAVLAYTTALITWLITDYVLANIINMAGANTLGNGLIIGFLCWLGFTAAITLMLEMFERHSISLWLINSGYSLAGLLISGAILGVWK